ncbi:MAG: alanine--tRNA ligase [Firmicutes bacterium]|nr:alanine--tRNA ligase [Bacillota bacterium]
MEKIGLNQLRTMFREFYVSKEHYARKSFSLIPEKDKSLLIINSGMAPLKPYFAGIETPPSKRMTTCQKCIRTGDIDNVGYTDRHGTFFEMLGSFSFGDYFKEESIKWGWEFITEVLKLPVDRVWPSVYEEDDEAYHIWKDIIGVPEEHIVRLGKDDNFWEIGTGPCGPCSEIYFDRGEEYGCGSPDCKPGCECDRFMEFWNHVFTQFNRDAEGNYTPLVHKNIDPGMGLERLACIMQGTDSIYAIDTLRYILDEVVRVSGVEYKEGAVDTDVSIRIITDHIRSVSFMIADGILPSNEGRGYVLRRLLRRAARHGRVLGIKGSFLADLSKKVVEISGEAYPELVERQDYIHKILTIEEEKFSKTIDQGTAMLEQYIADLKAKGETKLSGEILFRLYDTFGFPVELTEEILKEAGLEADNEGFTAYMEKQKEAARGARTASGDGEGWAEESLLADIDGQTKFVGYETLTAEGKVQGIFAGKAKAESAEEGEVVTVVLDQTPFYGEGGGQAGDLGILEGAACKAKVLNTTKFRGIFLHQVEILSGSLSVGETVIATVTTTNRNDTARNHTATHLLHKALKTVLGDHVDQAGSSVTADSLRFDFHHFEAVSKEDLAKVEEIVNEKIAEFIPVSVQELPIEEAKKLGAAAQFGEKYGDVVRVVSVGDYSIEFCGGTHVANSGQIGAFKILSESGVAAGVRRIEAITGRGLYKKIVAADSVINGAAEVLKTNKDGLLTKAASVTEELKAVKKELEEAKKAALSGNVDALLAEAKEVNGVRLLTKQYDNLGAADLRSLSDELRASAKNLVAVLAAAGEGKVSLLVSVSDDLLEKGYHAGKLIKEIAAAAGGKGGGKADMAQAGAKDAALLPEAFKKAEELL